MDIVSAFVSSRPCPLANLAFDFFSSAHYNIYLFICLKGTFCLGAVRNMQWCNKDTIIFIISALFLNN